MIQFSVSYELKGITPILFHADDIEGSDLVKTWRDDKQNKNKKVPGDDRTPAWTWQTYLYTDGKHIVWPSENITACLRKAGSQVTLKGKKTMKALAVTGLFFEQEFAEFRLHRKEGAAPEKVETASLLKIREKDYRHQCDAVQDMGFRLFHKRARVGSTKHVRCRARFDRWSIKGSIKVVSPDISFDTLSQIFEIAGFQVGLGDWRPGAPEAPGPYGMFEASLKMVK